jgi:hypothetical protein
LHDCSSALGQERRNIQEQFISWWFEGISEARSFVDLYARIDKMLGDAARVGYRAELIDEDTESFVVCQISAGDAVGVAVRSVWDEHEGSSVGCRFYCRGDNLTLAKARQGPIVEWPS